MAFDNFYGSLFRIDLVRASLLSDLIFLIDFTFHLVKGIFPQGIHR